MDKYFALLLITSLKVANGLACLHGINYDMNTEHRFEFLTVMIFTLICRTSYINQI